METKTFYNEVLTDHNMHPYHKHDIDNADLELEGVNPSCGDDIILKLKFDDAKKTIVDGAFTGDGCAISQASADIMLELIIGKPIDEAVHLSELFLKMIKDEATEEEIDELDEAVGERLEVRADFGLQPAHQDPGDDRDEQLHEERRVPGWLVREPDHLAFGRFDLGRHRAKVLIRRHRAISAMFL